jgi:hypothetical protein
MPLEVKDHCVVLTSHVRKSWLKFLWMNYDKKLGGSIGQKRNILLKYENNLQYIKGNIVVNYVNAYVFPWCCFEDFK